MKLRWVQFEKRMRELAIEEIAKSPVLKAEARSRRKRRWMNSNSWFGNIFLNFYILLMFGGVLARYGGLDLGLAVITLWATGTAFSQGQKWFEQFYASQELAVYSLLPISDQQVFQIQWRKHLRHSAWLLLGYEAVYTVLWRYLSKRTLPMPMIAAVAAGQAALVFALGLNLAAWLSFIPLGAIAGLLRTSAILLFLLAPLLPAQTDFLYKLIYSTSPSGWLNFMLLESAASKDFTALLLLLPIAIVFCASVYAWHRLRGYYSLEGIEFHTSAAALQEAELTENDFVRRGPTELEDMVRDRLFLQGIPWPSLSFLERGFARLLTERERTVMEFLIAGIPNWSNQVRWLLILFFFACAAVWLFGKTGSIAIFLIAYVLISMALPLGVSSWRGFGKVPAGGVFMPAYCIVPLTFGEMSRIVFKYNLCRLILISPLLAAFTIFCGWRMDFSFADSWLIAARLIAVLFALQPLLLVLPISKSSDSTARMKAIWLLILLPLIMGIAGFTILVFETDILAWIALSWVMILGGSVLFLLTFRWAYRRGKFDLLTSPRD